MENKVIVNLIKLFNQKEDKQIEIIQTIAIMLLKVADLLSAPHK